MPCRSVPRSSVPCHARATPRHPRDSPHSAALWMPSPTLSVTPLIPRCVPTEGTATRALSPSHSSEPELGCEPGWGLCCWGHREGTPPSPDPKVPPGPDGSMPGWWHSMADPHPTAVRKLGPSPHPCPLPRVGVPPFPPPSARPGPAPRAREIIKDRAKVRGVKGNNSAVKLLSCISRPHVSAATPRA